MIGQPRLVTHRQPPRQHHPTRIRPLHHRTQQRMPGPPQPQTAPHHPTHPTAAPARTAAAETHTSATPPAAPPEPANTAGQSTPTPAHKQLPRRAQQPRPLPARSLPSTGTTTASRRQRLLDRRRSSHRPRTHLHEHAWPPAIQQTPHTIGEPHRLTHMLAPSTRADPNIPAPASSPVTFDTNRDPRLPHRHPGSTRANSSSIGSINGE